MTTVDRHKIVYRPVGPDDGPFLYRLYASP